MNRLEYVKAALKNQDGNQDLFVLECFTAQLFYTTALSYIVSLDFKANFSNIL